MRGRVVLVGAIGLALALLAASSALEVIALDPLYLSDVTVPVLIIDGDHDSGVTQDGIREQARHFTGSHDVTTAILPNAGHIFFLERRAATARTAMSDWLHERGF